MPYADLGSLVVGGTHETLNPAARFPSQPFCAYRDHVRHSSATQGLHRRTAAGAIERLASLQTLYDWMNQIGAAGSTAELVLARLASSPAASRITNLQPFLNPTTNNMATLGRFPRLKAVRLAYCRSDADAKLLKQVPNTVTHLAFYRFGDRGQITSSGQAALAALPIRTLYFESHCPGVNRKLFEHLAESPTLTGLDVKNCHNTNLAFVADLAART